MKIEQKNVKGFLCIHIGLDGFMYRNKSTGLQVIQSVSIEQDEKQWIHTSFSRRSRIPTYADIQLIKKYFIGDDKKAIMVFPEKVNHVNIHEFCLHLWTCLGVDPLPDFTQGSGSI